MQIKREISEIRHELDKLIGIRETLSELIMEVSRRLDRLIADYIAEDGDKTQ